ncbi:MAG: carboxypeptidase regulatory-like domain-containing protein [Eggerthellaceae bacterium]|nr:carboxypeptidase regulatory-like domain-containing protein [Eggerthellaceae bacterium]
MRKIFLVDINKCIGCRSCQVACKDEHCDNDWSPIAKPQPQTGHFWLELTENERGRTPYVRVDHMPKLCNHCADAPCMAAAAAAGKSDAVYRRDDGLVVVDPEKAQGMRTLVDACPYGEIFWNESLELPQKCTGCAHLLDDGWSVPRCVDACPADALRFGDESEFAGELAAAETLQPELGTGAAVYYLNMPKRFVAGEVYDPEEDEVVIGADVVLRNVAGNTARTLKTDDFGDFWFDQIPADVYSVDIKAYGFEPVSLSTDTTTADAVLDSVALRKIQ